MSDRRQVQLLILYDLIENLLLQAKDDVVNEFNQFHLIVLIRLVEDREILLYDVFAALFAQVCGVFCK